MSRRRSGNHLYPDGNIQPDDWLYWTNAGQNWNGMCAECHSTNLEKGYDPETGVYCTTWSEIDVSCEACHGPGSRHVEWAELPDMARSRELENFGLVVRTGNLDAAEQVQLCAPCHSRRTLLGDYNHGRKDMMDNLVPELLNESTYFPDGQILDEVYVYGSFVQSKMYRNHVRCSDCHDIHSLKPVKQGNDLCLQCHRGDAYDTKEHHFHKKKGEAGEAIYADNGKKKIEVGEGAECVKCHMPGRYYMGIDYRPDHSIRIPRPDITGKLNIPDACNRCHQDKSTKWSVDQLTHWYGISRKPHYGAILAAGRKQIPGARGELIKLANDPLYPVLVRVTALSLLSVYTGEDSTQAFKRALDDPEALIRHTAVRFLNPPAPAERIILIVPLLYDPVKAVRIEAAVNLTAVPAGQLDVKQGKAFQDVLLEYQKAMEYSAAGLYIKAGKLREAKQIVEQLVASHPGNSVGPDLLNFINSKLQAQAHRQGFSYRGANKIKIK